MNELIEMWKSNNKIIEKMKISQLINFVFEGTEEEKYDKLKDFFEIISNELLSRYIMECIKNKFEESGFVLQDLLNELGKRLGFNVKYGLHRGRKGENGYDGIWTTNDGYSIIIESKKTDVYSISLETVNKYREQLIESKEIQEEKSSILIIIGKKETGVVEQQIRGSRYAWDIRIIGVEALLRLLEIKNELNDKKTLQQIYEILKPQEYTKIDKLVDLIFFTTEDSKLDDEVEENTRTENNIDVRHEKSIKAIENKLNITLIKKLKNMYTTKDNKIGIIPCVSKKHEKSKKTYYWFAYHPYFYANLQECQEKYIAYICEGDEKIILIPIEEIEVEKDKLNCTKKDKRIHWHIIIDYKDEKFKLMLPKGNEKEKDITKYQII